MAEMCQSGHNGVGSGLYKDSIKFGQMSLMNIANAGKFSADRAIDDYAKNIWNLEKIK